MKSKTIIISSQTDTNERNSGRGILTLFQEDELLKCRLRLYNVNKLNRYCKLGIYHNNEVFSANLLEKNGVYESSFVGDFDIDQDFYTAIIDTSNDNEVILSGGTYAGFFFNDNSVFEKRDNSVLKRDNSVFEKHDNSFNNPANNFKNIEKENPDTNLYKYNENLDSSPRMTKELKNNSSTPKTNCESCDKCANCKYKEYFYANNEDSRFFNFTPNETPITQNEDDQIPLKVTNEINNLDIKNNDKTQNETKENESTSNEDENKKSIIQAIIPQFKYVFENYQQDETLTNLIPNSKFVKINENNEQYSIGAIYEQEEMKYICYAVMCNYNTPAPQELGEHYQWLPLDKEDPLSEGYYIVFQDAKDLKILEL